MLDKPKKHLDVVFGKDKFDTWDIYDTIESAKENKCTHIVPIYLSKEKPYTPEIINVQF